MIVHWHVDGADCCLIGILLGVTVKKISPNNNIALYPTTHYHYRSNRTYVICFLVPGGEWACGEGGQPPHGVLSNVQGQYYLILPRMQ